MNVQRIAGRHFNDTENVRAHTHKVIVLFESCFRSKQKSFRLPSSMVCAVVGSDNGPLPTSLNACTTMEYLLNLIRSVNINSPPSSPSPYTAVMLCAMISRLIGEISFLKTSKAVSVSIVGSTDTPRFRRNENNNRFRCIGGKIRFPFPPKYMPTSH